MEIVMIFIYGNYHVIGLNLNEAELKSSGSLKDIDFGDNWNFQGLKQIIEKRFKSLQITNNKFNIDKILNKIKASYFTEDIIVIRIPLNDGSYYHSVCQVDSSKFIVVVLSCISGSKIFPYYNELYKYNLNIKNQRATNISYKTYFYKNNGPKNRGTYAIVEEKGGKFALKAGSIVKNHSKSNYIKTYLNVANKFWQAANFGWHDNNL